jgi:hypothetical protein
MGEAQVSALIGLVGYAGSGKSTAAERMVERLGYARVKFADPLKQALRAILRSAGVDEKTIERMIEGDLKVVPAAELCGRTPRYAMLTLGTEWGRGLMATNFWIHLFVTRVDRLRNQGHSIVVDDARFPNEFEAIRDLGGMLIKVMRPGLVPDLSHESEQHVESAKPDYVVVNGRTPADLGEAMIHAHRSLYGRSL